MTNTSSLQSMTGFGAASGETDGLSWRWELRSVNGKGLDLKLRLPSGAEGLEPELRAESKALHRGSVSANLKIERDVGIDSFALDEEALAGVASAIMTIRTRIECAPPRPEAILALRGILASPTPDEGLRDEELAALKAGFGEALGALLHAREAEGARIAAVLKERCAEIETKVAHIRRETERTREELAARLQEQISEILEDNLPEDRIAQEAAFLAIKADIREELDRLDVHTASFKALLTGDKPAGRRLEFLSQELMREATTLTSKVHSAALKHEGLDLKELIDSLREQVLNIA
ncbi:MAG: YicC/YloC family endoribonuclease [Parvularcula sp.]|jgi:uncharacterized protein (TIGR00255 family)|nr:YicC/YloC family endoribonuclease [Parvularcula sp.]